MSTIPEKECDSLFPQTEGTLCVETVVSLNSSHFVLAIPLFCQLWFFQPSTILLLMTTCFRSFNHQKFLQYSPGHLQQRPALSIQSVHIYSFDLNQSLHHLQLTPGHSPHQRAFTPHRFAVQRTHVGMCQQPTHPVGQM